MFCKRNQRVIARRRVRNRCRKAGSVAVSHAYKKARQTTNACISICFFFNKHISCIMLFKCRKYMSAKTHEANMLQRQHQHELTQQHTIRPQKSSFRFFPRQPHCILFHSETIMNVEAAWTLVAKTTWSGQIHKTLQTLPFRTVCVTFWWYLLVLLECHDLSLPIQIQPCQCSQNLPYLTWVVNSASVFKF